MLSVLRLDAVRLDQLVLRSRPGHAGPRGEETYSFVLQHREFTVESEQAERMLQLRLRIQPESKTAPALAVERIEIHLTGFFSFAERASETLKKKVYPMAAVSMLLGVARGVIAQTTGLFPTGTFMLPPLDVTRTAKRKRLTGTCTLIPSAVRSDQLTAAVSDQSGQ